MPAKKTDTPPIDLDLPAPDLGEMWHSTVTWFQVHYLSILIAFGAGILIYLALSALKSAGKRLSLIHI